jgi:high affinity cGMP-specific 3',5'-cyclic phosphodiesterase 9
MNEQNKKISFGINNLMHLVNNLNLYSELVDNLATVNFSVESKKIYDKMNETIKQISDQSNQLYLNRPRDLIRTNSNKNFDCEFLQSRSESPIQKSKSYDELDIKIILNKSFDFDSTIYSKQELCQIAFNMISDLINLDDIDVCSTALKKFICKVSQHYHLNPYHNFAHAISTLQFVYYLLKKIINLELIIDKYEIFALLISALVHDIDHPGHTNAFEINYKSHLAYKYSNSSVLENHHCSTAFYIMQLPEIQLIGSMTMENFNKVRNTIIECIMSTDMKYHEDFIKLINGKKLEWYFNNPVIFTKLIIHIADLSNQVRPFEICKIGSENLRREFSNQIEKEERLKLSVTENLRIGDNKAFYKSELGFSQYIVLPLVNIITNMFPEIDEIKDSLEQNILSWQNLLENYKLDI